MIDRRLPGFLIAGGINTAFGYGVYGALVLLGTGPHVALLCSTVFGVFFNFLTTGTVFRSRDPRLLPRFIAVYAIMLGLNMILLDKALGMGIGPLPAQAIAILIFTPLTFLAMRRFVFAVAPEPTP